MKNYNDSILSKLYNYFTQRVKLKNSTKGWKRCDCFYCGGKHTMGIQFNLGRIHCFKCEKETDLIHALMDMENFDTLNEAWNFLKIQDEYERFDKILTFNDEETKRKKIILPNSFRPLLTKRNDSLLGDSAINYLRERKLDLEKLSKKGVGFCTKGEYAGYVIFPIYEKGRLIFYQGRKFTPYGTKMKNPDYEKFGIGKSELLYNADALYIYKKCYLVESITNAETLGDNAVAGLGKDFSEVQIRKIINSPCQRLILILDPDALDKSIRLALIFSLHKSIKLVQLPENEDVNSYGLEKTNEIIGKTKYGTYKDFFRLKIENDAKTQHSYN